MMDYVKKGKTKSYNMVLRDKMGFESLGIHTKNISTYAQLTHIDRYKDPCAKNTHTRSE